MKPKLLVLELWGLGDLVIATPFLQAAARHYAVTLLAKPYAAELRPRFWPEVEVIPFTAPWTAFRGKYQLWRWSWGELFRLRRGLVARNFDYGVSARWDPRDHLVLKLAGARERLGFSRLKSRRYLTRELTRPAPLAHRYESWCVAGMALGLKLPERAELFVRRGGDNPQSPSPQPAPRLGGAREAKTQAPSSWPSPPAGAKESKMMLLHSGARLPLRVWPLDNFLAIATRLRTAGFHVQIACDADQLGWWRSHGEEPVCPHTVTELIAALDQAGAFFGNDSGPGHLAAACGLPTFTLFGPQLHEWFAPLHPASEVVEGKACPYKPCSDYCRFPEPFCLRGLTVEEVWPRVRTFLDKFVSQTVEGHR